jgi:hypothetical protein
MEIKVKDLKYKICSHDKAVFGAFQVILSNGTSSPVFAAIGENDHNMESFNIKDYS